MLRESEIACESYKSSCVKYIQEEKEELKNVFFFLINDDAEEGLSRITGLMEERIRIEKNPKIPLCCKKLFD
jgi:hypothetical protein